MPVTRADFINEMLYYGLPIGRTLPSSIINSNVIRNAVVCVTPIGSSDIFEWFGDLNLDIDIKTIKNIAKGMNLFLRIEEEGGG